MLSNTSSEAKEVCGWTGWRTPRFVRSKLAEYTTIENAHKVRKKTFDFLLCIEVQHIFSFSFSLLRYYEMPEYFYVNNCCFELMQQFYHATESGLCSQYSQRLR